MLSILAWAAQAVEGGGGLAWTRNTPIPAERETFVPGWTVGRQLFALAHGSEDAWTGVAGPDGLLAWTLLPRSGFSASKWSNPVLALGARVYAFGHWGTSRSALLEPSGRMSRWTDAQKERGMAGARLPLLWGCGVLGELKRHRFLYHLGGFAYEGDHFTNPRSQNKVFYAAVRPDGLLTGWQATTPLPYHPMGACAVFHEGRIYAGGGRGGRFGAGDAVDGMIDDLYRADLREDGTLSEWTRLERKLPWKGCGIQAFLRDGWLYVAGGELEGDGAGTATRYTDGFARARLEGGQVGEWEPLAPLPAPTGKSPAGWIGDTYYIVGRSSGGRTPVYSLRFPPLP